MRLTSLYLKNFRQYDDRRFNFEQGSTAIRGANEAGKSTLIEGLFYALGGAEFCRNNDYVRWGAKKGECRVEAVFVARNGDEVKITRTPNAAELLVNGEVQVTGQRPVNKASAERFGLANLTIARRIMFVEQGQIRGILEEANAKAVDTIESLTGLDIIDWLIQRVQDATTVDAGVVRGQVQTLQESIDAAQAEAVEVRAQLPAAAESVSLAADAAAVAEKAKDAAQGAAEAAMMALASLPNYDSEIRAARAQVTNAETHLAGALESLNAARADAGVEVEDYRPLQLQLESAGTVLARNHARKVLDIYRQSYPADFWDGTYDELVAEGKKAAALVEQLQAEIGSASVELAKYDGMRISGTCTICGLDVSEVPAAVAKNQEIDDQVYRLQEVVARAKARLADTKHTLNILRALAGHRVPEHQFLVRTDEVVWPPKFQDLGEAEPTADMGALRDAIARAQKVEATKRAAVERLPSLEALHTEASNRLAAAQTVLAEVEAAAANSTLQRRAAEDAAQAAKAKAQEAEAVWRDRSKALASIYAREGEMERQVQRLELQVAGWQESIVKAQETLANAAFNDELISALRRARPLVANRLWDMVLKAVTQYLSRSRNQVSEVKKVDKSFTVNGHPFDSLSGSAIDMLGLAIRVALLKIFAPGVELMILDEPFGACDAERQRDALAFLLAQNIGQVFIVTHEPTTEAVCDNVIGV